MIYLDYNATTPTDPRVLDKMLPYFYDRPGNAASRSHAFGWMAEEAVSQARQQIADLVHGLPKEIIFTSGATEGDNLGIKGIFEAYKRKGKHIVTCVTEHKAILDTCYHLEKLGAEVTYLPVGSDGLISMDELQNAIRKDTICVAIMWANNETGVIQPMEEIGHICEEKATLLFSDATQAVGKIKVDPRNAGVQVMAFSGHKMYGPKGIGAVYVSQSNPRVKLTAQMDGGGHEMGMRSGTLNVPGIVGLGEACKLAGENLEKEYQRLSDLRNYMEDELMNEIEGVSINGTISYRLPHVSNLHFKHVDGEQLMMSFHEVMAVASGSACTSADPDPSHVLMAMGLTETQAKNSIRISMGRFTTEEEINEAIKIIKTSIEQLRSINPVWEMYKAGVDLDD